MNRWRYNSDSKEIWTLEFDLRFDNVWRLHQLRCTSAIEIDANWKKNRDFGLEFANIEAYFFFISDSFSFIRNAWLAGKWGKEECSSTFPFSPGETFNIAIRRSFDHFSVWVDGKLAGEFKVRGEVDNIDTVYVHGDVIVKTLYMREYMEDKYFSRSRENLKPASL